MCAYSLLYPLTAETGEAFAEGTIRTVKELPPEALSPDFSGARYLYVGMLLGIPQAPARSLAKELLGEELARRIASARIELIFARPATDAGLRLLRAFGFSPVADAREVWAVPGDRLAERLPAPAINRTDQPDAPQERYERNDKESARPDSNRRTSA